jgi:AAA domain
MSDSADLVAEAARLLEGLPAKARAADSPLVAALRDRVLPELRETVELYRDDLAAGAAEVPVRSRSTEIPPRDDVMPLITIDALLDSPEEPTRFLVEGLLFSGGASVIAGKPKNGKSTLARTLVRAVASGEDFLGRAVEQGSVVYVNFEEKRGEAKRLFGKLESRGLPIRTYIGKSLNGAVRALRRAIEELPTPPALVVIDTLQKLLRSKDLNDYAAVTEALEPLLNLAREVGAHVCLVHHTVKGERGDPIDEVLGSTAIAAFADTVLVLKRDTHRRRFLWAEGRSGVEMDEVVLELDPDTERVASAGSREGVEQAEVAARILDYLRGQQGPVTETLIRKDVEGDSTTIGTASRPSRVA